MRMSALFLVCAAHLLSAMAAEPTRERAEVFLMLPEPRVMGTAISKPWADSRRTVFTPAHEKADGTGITAYTKVEFDRLGISWEKFLEQAQASAEKRLVTLKPELKQDEKGRLLYAVFRSDSPTIASLLVAPSLARLFERLIGPEVWVVAPDRHSLFIFPPGEEAMREFAADLASRFEGDAFAASDEIYALRSDGTQQKVVGTFSHK